MGAPTRGQTRWLFGVWAASVLLVSVSALVPVWINVPRTGMLSNFAALILLATIPPVLWRARGGRYLAFTAVFSALAVGGSVSYAVVALAFNMPEAFRSSVQWSIAGVFLSMVFVHAVRRSFRERPPGRLAA